jgi:hypothetical protein
MMDSLIECLKAIERSDDAARAFRVPPQQNVLKQCVKPLAVERAQGGRKRPHKNGAAREARAPH